MTRDIKSRDYEVCPCRHVTRGQIEDKVRETGISNLRELCEAVNAGNKCGGCREMMENIMNETLAEMNA